MITDDLIAFDARDLTRDMLKTALAATLDEPMKPTDAMVEKAARTLCEADRCDPEYLIYYRSGIAGNVRVYPLPESGGQSMPLWRWGYEERARAVLTAAFADAHSGDEKWFKLIFPLAAANVTLRKRVAELEADRFRNPLELRWVKDKYGATQSLRFMNAIIGRVIKSGDQYLGFALIDDKSTPATAWRDSIEDARRDVELALQAEAQHPSIPLDDMGKE